MTNYDPRDYRVVTDTFAEMFDAYRTNERMRLPGRNFMTDDVLGVLKIDGELVEISTGMFLDDRLFGVTFDRERDADPVDERNGAFDSLEAVRDHLVSLTDRSEVR